jgi:Tfp pilus assembly protein PilO
MIYRISKKVKFLIYVAVVCVGLAVLNMILLRPLMGKSANLDRRIQLKRQMVENSLRLLSQKEDIQNESGKLVKFTKQSFSEEEETASFLNDIEDIAKKSQVLLVALRPYSAVKLDFYIEYKIELEAESQMNQLMAFVYNLQNSENILRVRKFNISPKADNPNMLRANLTVTTVLIP